MCRHCIIFKVERKPPVLVSRSMSLTMSHNVIMTLLIIRLNRYSLPHSANGGGQSTRWQPQTCCVDSLHQKKITYTIRVPLNATHQPILLGTYLSLTTDMMEAYTSMLISLVNLWPDDTISFSLSLYQTDIYLVNLPEV